MFDFGCEYGVFCIIIYFSFGKGNLYLEWIYEDRDRFIWFFICVDVVRGVSRSFFWFLE